VPLDAKVLLFFGQIKDVKGLDLLLEAMPEVLKKHPGAVLLIAGKPWKSDFSAYEAQMERLAIRERCITHIRFIPDDDVPLYYGACELVVLPYRRIYQSGVLLMAMSYGRPVLTSDLDSFADVIEEGKTGMMFTACDSQALANRLIQALSDPESLHRIANSGQQFVSKNFNWDQIGKMTIDCYRAI